MNQKIQFIFLRVFTNSNITQDCLSYILQKYIHTLIRSVPCVKLHTNLKVYITNWFKQLATISINYMTKEK